MTLDSITNRISYVGDAVEDTFAYTFKIFATSDLKVYVAGALQTLTTHYTVTGAGEASGGNVVFEAGSIPGDGDIIDIIRDLPLTQSTDYGEGEDLPADTLEYDLDKLTMKIQRLLGRLVAWPIATLADEATPSVLSGRLFVTGGTTTITDFDDGVTGQIITIIAEHATPITHGTNIFLNGDATRTMTSGDTLQLVCKADNKWYEIPRTQ